MSLHMRAFSQESFAGSDLTFLSSSEGWCTHTRKNILLDMHIHSLVKQADSKKTYMRTSRQAEKIIIYLHFFQITRQQIKIWLIENDCLSLN